MLFFPERETHWPIYYFVITTETQCCYFQLYWDLQLLNVRNLNTLHEMNKPVSHALNCLHQSTEPNTFIKTHNQSDSGYTVCTVQSCTFDTDSLQVCACSVADFPLCGISGPVDHHIYFPCTEGETVGEEGAVWECEDCEETQESSQALLGQVSIWSLGLRSWKVLNSIFWLYHSTDGKKFFSFTPLLFTSIWRIETLVAD